MDHNEILRIRTALEMSRQQFAKYIGCSPSAVRQWESPPDPEKEWKGPTKARFIKALSLAQAYVNAHSVEFDWNGGDLQAIRMSLGKSSEEFAHDLGCDEVSIKRVEAGKLIQPAIYKRIYGGIDKFKDRKSVAKEIKSLRDFLGKTQAQFASLLGVTPVTVSLWERGKMRPGPAQDLKLDKIREYVANKKVEECLRKKN